MTSTTVTYTNIDADTHITESPDVWTARVPAKFRDRVPVMTRDAQGQDIWTLDGEQIYTVKFSAPAGWPPLMAACSRCLYAGPELTLHAAVHSGYESERAMLVESLGKSGPHNMLLLNCG